MKTLELIREKISWKSTGSSIFLVFNSFVWYIFTYQLMNDKIFEGFSDQAGILNQMGILLFSCYFICLAIAAIIGAKIIPQFRVKALVFWVLFGGLSTPLLFFIPYQGLIICAIITSVLGISVGIGLPSCLSFFAESTKIDNRSFTGGIIWSLVGVFVLGFALIFTILSVLEFLTLITIWRFLGISFILLTRSNEKSDIQKTPSYFELIKDRKIQLYLFPWIMFTIINFAEAPMIEVVIGSDVFPILQLVTWFLVGIFANIGGYIADIVGRKRVIIAGFVMLGIEYAAMSTFNTEFTGYLFIFLDGVSWGLLLSVFFMSLWGDLGEYHVKEKYYVLGGLPYLLANFLYVLIQPITHPENATSAFTVATFFLFLAILPLIYTTETLPEKKIKERELKNYLENAQKIRNKYS